MSYRSSINNRYAVQTFYNNTETVGTLPNNPASVQYVNTTATGITGNLDSINQSIATLNQQVTTLQTDVNTLNNQIVRIVGSIILSPSFTLPPYSLLCNGASISKTTYPQLFTVIGYAYGGSGTNFNLPNFINYFPLGGNGTTNGVASSNLISGNGATGATNTQFITNSTYLANPTIPQFPLMTAVPAHYHTLTDPGHRHYISDVGNVSYGVASTSMLQSSGTAPISSDIAYTGITVNSSGTNIQQVDPVSGLQGVNFTPPFLAMNFFIVYQ